jgi:hypothetical protein
MDLLVDSTSGPKLFSLMDAFSEYNQIYMDEADQEETSFIIERGLYCYKIMSFGLKNVEGHVLEIGQQNVSGSDWPKCRSIH